MSYDNDTSTDPSAPVGPRPFDTAHPRDLEVLITLLELAALELTPTAGATFTRDEVVALAAEIGGEDCGVREHDLRIVLDGSNFLRREAGGRWSLK